MLLTLTNPSSWLLWPLCSMGSLLPAPLQLPARCPPLCPSCPVSNPQLLRCAVLCMLRHALLAGLCNVISWRYCEPCRGNCHQTCSLHDFAPTPAVDKFGRRFLFIEGGIQMAAAQVRRDWVGWEGWALAVPCRAAVGPALWAAVAFPLLPGRRRLPYSYACTLLITSP